MTVTVGGVEYFQMADAIYVNDLPAGMDAYGGYVAGTWPTYQAMVAAFPNALHLSISPFASVQADCLDVETGDATVGQIAGWLNGWKQGNTPLPVIYTSAGNIAAAVAAAGRPRNSYLIWSSHYKQGQHICGPGTCGYPQADGTQWDDPGTYDPSLLPLNFFNPTVEADMPLTTADEPIIEAAIVAATPALVAAVQYMMRAEFAPPGELQGRLVAAANESEGQMQSTLVAAITTSVLASIQPALISSVDAAVLAAFKNLPPDPPLKGETATLTFD